MKLNFDWLKGFWELHYKLIQFQHEKDLEKIKHDDVDNTNNENI